jgi:hypothetical protein
MMDIPVPRHFQTSRDTTRRYAVGGGDATTATDKQGRPARSPASTRVSRFWNAAIPRAVLGRPAAASPFSGREIGGRTAIFAAHRRRPGRPGQPP